MISRRVALMGLGATALASRGAAMMPALPAASFVPPLGGRFTQGGWARGQAGAKGAVLKLDGVAVPTDAEGRFLIAFDRDAGPQARLSGWTAQGAMLSDVVLSIAPRSWRIEHVDAPFHPPSLPDEEFARLRKAELEQINAARALRSPAEGWRQSFVWPAPGRVSGLFGSQRTYRGGAAGAYHSGLDIAAGAGTPYVAPADGVVVLAAEQPFTLEGHLLMVDHGMGLVSAFLHASALLVRVGERVAQGQPLGRVGMTGRATGPHLHWSLRWNEARLDPLLFVPPR